MRENTIVTIGRQFGAGGHRIGEKLATALGIPFYDREIIDVAAKNSGLSPTILESHDEKPAHPFFLSSWGGPFMTPEQPLGQQVFQAEFEAIRSFADKGSCVIVGRCADFVLAGRVPLLRVFLHAPTNARIARIRERLNIDEEAARRLARAKDKDRMAYYNYFTDRKWGATETYDLCLDTSLFSESTIVSLLLSAAEAAHASPS